MGTPPLMVSGNKGLIFMRSIEKFHNSPEQGACISEWAVNEVGDISDVERWYRTNPSLGYQLLISALVKDSLSMSADTFAREHLGLLPKRHETLNYAIPVDIWDANVSDETGLQGKRAFGVKFSADGTEVVLCGAVIPKDGLPRIELIDRKPTGYGTQWLADWLNARYTQASCVVIDGRNGVDVLVDKISGTWKYKGSVIRPRATDMIAAVSLLMDSLNENTITWYRKQDALRDSAITSIKRPISGGWGFGGDNCTPIEACALALWGAKTSKRDPSKVMRIG